MPETMIARCSDGAFRKVTLVDISSETPDGCNAVLAKGRDAYWGFAFYSRDDAMWRCNIMEKAFSK